IFSQSDIQDGDGAWITRGRHSCLSSNHVELAGPLKLLTHHTSERGRHDYKNRAGIFRQLAFEFSRSSAFPLLLQVVQLLFQLLHLSTDGEIGLFRLQGGSFTSFSIGVRPGELAPQRLHLMLQPDRLVHCRGPLQSQGASEDGVAVYYQQQVEMLEGFNEMDALAECGFLPGMSKEERDKMARSERMAIRLSNIANMILFAAKVYASIRSGSLAIIASTLDSLLDLLSGFILWFTTFSMPTQNPYRYPIGKKRMQPLGILVFASVMATLGMQIIFESVRILVSNEDKFHLTKEQEAWVISIMLSVTLVKFLLVLHCRSFTNEIVKAYAQDHFFDVITNIIGLVAALLAKYVNDCLDPVGAILSLSVQPDLALNYIRTTDLAVWFYYYPELALYTIRTWSSTVLENVNSLVGKSAAPEYLQKLTYLCWNHHKAIRHIDTVRAYTFGSQYFVEVDIVLPSDMPLREAHDIGESLQEKLEQLLEIERAFVHLDYEFGHKPEHAQSHS
ncbi:hypothetical protein IFM89_008993, partial [Coptis chinensis]